MMPAAAQSMFVGRQFFAGYQLPVELGPYDPAQAFVGHYGLIHIAHGTGLIEGPDGPVMVAAPAVILLDETTRPTIIRRQSLVLDVLFFEPGVINSLFTPDLLRATAVFDGTVEQDAYLLRRFLEPDVAGRPLLLSATLHQRVGEALSRVGAEGAAQIDAHWPCRTRSWLIELLFQLRVANPQVQQLTTPASDDRLDQALLFVHERFNTEFTLDDVARWCGSNRTQVNLRFRALTGQSLRQYVIGLRLRVASSLLRDTGLPIAEIMARVGYENGSNFTRTFRGAFGQTPREHRRTVRPGG
ncbi:MAG: AraC-type DNA-binding protein [Devosia sp.]|uniref:helix-turn-helix domain-containing protein n=1 Tax=Devosia sp. TaxID=1871048 RepID=UPI00262634E7|nr:AraC family transcriptional regulator [Devosia sp.]MDB5530076.1 AraC-type DNA-binding protein [Devosia sp.]